MKLRGSKESSCCLPGLGKGSRQNEACLDVANLPPRLNGSDFCQEFLPGSYTFWSWAAGELLQHSVKATEPRRSPSPARLRGARHRAGGALLSFRSASSHPPAGLAPGSPIFGSPGQRCSFLQWFPAPQTCPQLPDPCVEASGARDLSFPPLGRACHGSAPCSTPFARCAPRSWYTPRGFSLGNMAKGLLRAWRAPKGGSLPGSGGCGAAPFLHGRSTPAPDLLLQLRATLPACTSAPSQFSAPD